MQIANDITNTSTAPPKMDCQISGAQSLDENNPTYAATRTLGATPNHGRASNGASSSDVSTAGISTEANSKGIKKNDAPAPVNTKAAQIDPATTSAIKSCRDAFFMRPNA